MKTLLVIIQFIVFLPAHSFSQDQLNLKDFSDKTTYWRISYLAGASFTFNPAFTSNSDLPAGYNGGIEIGYYPSGATAFFMNFNISRLKTPGSPDNYRFSDDAIEITMGPKIYLNNKQTVFVEGALGTYVFVETAYEHFDFENLTYYYTSHQAWGFGFEIGCGKDFELSKCTTLTLKAKLHNAFPDLKNAMYMGIYSAISFDNKNRKAGENNTVSEKSWALSLFGGINNPEFFHNRRYDWGVNYGIEAAFKTSPKVEYYVSVANNKIVRNMNYYDSYNINDYIFEITTGPRFIFNLDKVSSFFETGIGLYDNYTTGGSPRTFQSYSATALGMNLGTGLLINLTKSAALVTKGKINFLFSEKSDLTSYFTINAGVRVYL